MIETTAHEFRQTLKSKVDACIENHEIIKVKRRNGEGFVVLGESDWSAIEETLYLNQFSGLADSIQQAAREPLAQGTPLQDLDL